MDFSNVIQLLIYRMIKVFRPKHIFTVLLPFRFIPLDPPDCCYSSNGITVVSLCLRKTGLAKVTLSEPRKHCHLNSARPVTYSCPSSEPRAMRWPGKSHCQSSSFWNPLQVTPFDTLLTAVPWALKLQGAAHATTQNKGFWNITLNEQSEWNKPTETERTACPLTLWATEPTSQGFSGKQAEIQSQPSRRPRMWTIKGFVIRKKREDLSNFLLF